MPKSRKPKAPPSPLTGLYLVRNSNGCYLKRGSYPECVAFAKEYTKDRRANRLPADGCVVLAERLWVECQELKRLRPSFTIPISKFAIEAAQAWPTGRRVEAWWGGMEGGPAMFEEWEAVLGNAVPALEGIRVRCYRGGTCELDRLDGSCPGHYLTALEVLND